MKYSIEKVYIECTRRCNLQCGHCMRGPAQNVDLSKEYVDMFFDRLNICYIDQITFGGGEPTLNPEIISYAVDKIIQSGIMVDTIGMITNGQKYSEEIVEAFERFQEYMRSVRPYNVSQMFDDSSIIGFSIDDFHKSIGKEVRNLYLEHEDKITLYNHATDNSEIVKTGLSKVGREFKYRLPKPNYVVVDENETYIYEDLNLSALGNITTTAWGAYVDADKKNFGFVGDFDITKFLIKYGVPLKGPKLADVVGPQRRMFRRG